MFFLDEKFKTCFAFHLPALETLIGQNSPEIANLEFETHGLLEIHVFLPIEQAGTNKC